MGIPMSGYDLAGKFGRLYRGPLCCFMVLWCFVCRGWRAHGEVKRFGWQCQSCGTYTVRFEKD